jgi:CheY-like chemotaxis protein
MDVQMPVMDGIEATEKIREHERASGLPPLPIIALTAGVYADDRQRCLACGMNDFLAKPLELEALRQMLGKWLQGVTDSKEQIAASTAAALVQ